MTLHCIQREDGLIVWYKHIIIECVLYSNSLSPITGSPLPPFAQLAVCHALLAKLQSINMLDIVHTGKPLLLVLFSIVCQLFNRCVCLSVCVCVYLCVRLHSCNMCMQAMKVGRCYTLTNTRIRCSRKYLICKCGRMIHGRLSEPS